MPSEELPVPSVGRPTVGVEALGRRASRLFRFPVIIRAPAAVSLSGNRDLAPEMSGVERMLKMARQEIEPIREEVSCAQS